MAKEGSLGLLLLFGSMFFIMVGFGMVTVEGLTEQAAILIGFVLLLLFISMDS